MGIVLLYMKRNNIYRRKRKLESPGGNIKKQEVDYFDYC